MLSACAPYAMRDQASANQDGRVRYLIFHFTSEDTAESLRLLTQPSANPVSAHYLVDVADAPGDRVVVHRLVPENARAWHAGRSYWAGETALNASSIGIEIVNESNCSAQQPMAEDCEFLPYPPAQVDAVIALCRAVLARHPDIQPWRVLGHSDIAPARKVDPGPQFPWAALHEAGIGAWYEDAVVKRYRQRFAQRAPSLQQVQEALNAWGYDLQPTGTMDPPTQLALRAFQLHFRPERFDGLVDTQTSAILFALLERYRPEQLARLDMPSAAPRTQAR